MIFLQITISNVSSGKFRLWQSIVIRSADKPAAFTNLPFKIGEIQYEKPTTITLSDDQTTTLKQVPVGATVTITEDDYSNDRYTPSYAIDGKPSGTNNREAKITSISKRDNDVPHEVIFTNNKDAIPDTGLDLNTTPYILALCIVAAGAGVLLFRRRKRWS